MFGTVLLLHFGLFQLLALAWQRTGIPVKPLMCAPLLATSLGNFWGACWNTGFHALAHEFAFRPLRRRFGRGFAVLAIFLLSGLVHELVITVPAREATVSRQRTFSCKGWVSSWNEVRWATGLV
jgi:alginate O-acetyltransferase complex protein AlgI